MPLDKLNIGALVSTVVMVLGVFGIGVPAEVSAEIVAIGSSVMAIIAYFGTAYMVTERKSKIDKLVTK